MVTTHKNAPGEGRIESPAPVGVPLLALLLQGDGDQHGVFRTPDGDANASPEANMLLWVVRRLLTAMHKVQQVH